MNNYSSVQNRCCFDTRLLGDEITKEEVEYIFTRLGFQIHSVDLLELLRPLVGVTEFRLRVPSKRVPEMVDCSSLMKWVYAQYGIRIPRLAVQQNHVGTAVEGPYKSGDLLCLVGSSGLLYDDPEQKVGHVGIYTPEDTVIHASNKAGLRGGVHELPLHEFLITRTLVRVKRILPDPEHMIIVGWDESFDGEPIETSDDLKWRIIKNVFMLSPKRIPSFVLPPALPPMW